MTYEWHAPRTCTYIVDIHVHICGYVVKYKLTNSAILTLRDVNRFSKTTSPKENHRSFESHQLVKVVFDLSDCCITLYLSISIPS